jgi:uncharacterized repeat protein (TIGR01451 family)/CSLREA domain-containing protein
MRLEDPARAAILTWVLLLWVASPSRADTFTVDSTGDGSDVEAGDGECDADPEPGGQLCTLRAAIEEANADSAQDIIRFDISPAGPKTITPGIQLPDLTTPMTIDGTTQPGFAGKPIIEIDGSALLSGVSIHALNCTVRGLVINRLATNANLAAIVLGAGSGGAVVEGCYIGTDVSGTVALGNIGSGIIVGTANNRIGGTTPPQRNVISGNARAGISASGPAVLNNLIQGNFIGTNAAGTAILSNQTGISIGGGAAGNIVGGGIGVTPGGSCTGTCNLVSGSVPASGIFLTGSAANNTVTGNYIGTDVSGTLDLGNQGVGIVLNSGAADNRIGGTLPADRNLIAGNGSAGVFLAGATTTGNTVLGNFIGTRTDGTTPLPNLNGIIADAARDNVVGGTVSGAGNVIAGNGGNGITIQNGAANNRVEGNFIGTDLAGTAVVSNLNAGVRISNASDNVIGGSADGAANHIAHNGAGGVVVLGSSVRTSIRRNRIHTNTGLGIDLGNDGVTANDAGDADAGPNDLINFPEGINARHDAGSNQTIIRGHVDAPDPTAVSVELFENAARDPSNHGEGEKYLDTVTPNAEGAFCLTLPGQLAVGNLTATATDAAGSTSEFSRETGVELIALEVIQVVQDWNNSVVLIEDKPTHVRAHLQTIDPETFPIAVETRLRGFRNGAELTDSPLTALNLGEYRAPHDAIPFRVSWGGNVNFRLPESWLDGEVELRLVRADGEELGCREGRDPGGPADHCSDCRIRVAFVPTSRLKLRIHAMNWTQQDPFPFDWSFGNDQLERIARIVETMYPTPGVDLETAIHFWTGPVPPDVGLVTAGMTSFRILDGFPDRIYYGAIPGVGSGFLGGLANPPFRAASGFTTVVTKPEDDTNRTTAAHEIGHVLGRLHPVDFFRFGGLPGVLSNGACGDRGPSLANFPYFFDVGEVSPSATAGVTLMPTLGPMDPGGDPYEQVFGLDTFGEPPRVVSPRLLFDVMSYCDNVYPETWTSRHTYEALQTSLQDAFGPASTARRDVSAVAETYTIIRGRVAVRSGAVTIEPIFRLTSTSTPESSPAGPYTLRLLDASDRVIDEIAFAPTELQARGPDPEFKTFLIPVPSDSGIRKLVVLLDDVPLSTRAASANPPAVQVVSPDGGGSLSSDPVVLSWNAADPDGDPLLSFVQYSPDGGSSWETLLVDYPAQTALIPRSAFKATANGLIRVMVTDGFDTAQDQSNAAFSAPNNAPFVSLWRPGAGQMFAGEQQIVFEASGRDVEDGQLPASSLQWTSSLDGALGTGRTLLRKASQLTAGNHTITVTGTDSTTAAVSASVAIQVATAAPSTFADLSLEQSPSPQPPIAGSDLIYALRVANRGRDAATAVTLADILPSGVGFVSASATQGSCGQALGVVTCDLGSLEADAVATITIVVSPPSAGTITNSASVSAAEADPVPANNSFSLETLVEAAGATDLAIEKTDSADPIPVSGTLTYTLQVTNLGGNTAGALSVSDTLPLGTGFTAAKGAGWGCEFASGAVTCARPSLGIGAAPPITIAVTAPSAAGSIMNMASVSFGQIDTVPGNNSGSATTQVEQDAPSPDFVPQALAVDPSVGVSSDGNGVFEPGEAVAVVPSWRNDSGAPLALAGLASSFGGPAGPDYLLPDGVASYGTIDAGAAGGCSATQDCYSMSIVAASRPATHWDAQFTETPSSGDPPKVWKLHVGESFTDVLPPSTLNLPDATSAGNPFYAKIETLLHAGVTAGCTATTYCPGDPVTRAQMVIFIARALLAGAPVPHSGMAGGKPYDCVAGGASIYTDVSPTDIFCRHAHYLAARNVTLGCSATEFCPSANVTRDGMAAFIARALVAPGGGAAVPAAYGPDPLTGFSYDCGAGSPAVNFSDMPASGSFCKHVHYLWALGVVAGCGGDRYCPSGLVTRDAMAKFLANAFRLTFYGP